MNIEGELDVVRTVRAAGYALTPNRSDAKKSPDPSTATQPPSWPDRAGHLHHHDGESDGPIKSGHDRSNDPHGSPLSPPV
jgi:hypothetical protein